MVKMGFIFNWRGAPLGVYKEGGFQNHRMGGTALPSMGKPDISVQLALKTST